MSGAREDRLREFGEWVAKHIQGYEKGEAQIYLDRLFQAFGQKGSLDVGGKPEFRIRKGAEDGGGVAFADYVWKPVVLIEMKRRGEDLQKHFRQAFDYWVGLVPGRPRYAVLCNFDEFWVYDFDTQMDSPVDKVSVGELPTRWGPLAFLFPTRESPVFGNAQEVVTREAADRLAICFNKLVSRKVNRGVAQRFILQMLVALFAEDIDLLERYMVFRLLEDCKEPKDSYDLIGGLFEAMNTPDGVAGGRFKGVDYFNGGLFAEPVRLELYPDEIAQLKEASKADWSKVRPEIFGTLFEHSLEKEERHAYGAYFTSPVDIMKIVGPTITEPWREQIENATTLRRLNELMDRMHSYTVLDPACGSGNFLYIAYRELKRLEFRLHERITEMSARQIKGQAALGLVTARQFYGMDINPFAVELAKVTMMIGRKLAIDELHVNERPLPLDNLDDNFIAGDALIDEHGKRVQWPRSDVIIGNPPFLGAKLLKPERGADYVNAIRKAYPEVPGMADYCVYWLRKAHDHLHECTAIDKVGGRAGLVGTQNIRNNQSRVGGLDHIVATGTIVEAVENQPWSGEANVHVSIANWVKTQDNKILPAKRKLWSKLEPSRGIVKGRGVIGRPAHKQYELSVRECACINAALSDEVDVTMASELPCNTARQTCFQGLVPGYEGFVLSAAERKRIVAADQESAKVIHPFLIGRDLLTGRGLPARYIIDLSGNDILAAQKYCGAFQHVAVKVLPAVREKAEPGESHDSGRKGHLEKWWEMWRPRPVMLKALAGMRRYIACSRVTKRPVFTFVSSQVRADGALMVFTFEDDYSFGILQSAVHWQWFVTKCSKLKSDFRYTPPSVYNTFPWPQSPSVSEIDAVAEAGRLIRQIRSEALRELEGGLRALYRLLELPGRNPLKAAHSALDKAVLDAYGFGYDDDVLGRLLALNKLVAERCETGEAVMLPGVPANYPTPETLVTQDAVGSTM